MTIGVSLPARQGLRLTAQRGGIRLLYYHGIVPQKTDPLLERNFHLVSHFRENVRFLARRRTHPFGEFRWITSGCPPSLPYAAVLRDVVPGEGAGSLSTGLSDRAARS